MATEDIPARKTSLSYWIICILFLLIACFGVYDYTMIRRHDHQYLLDLGSIPTAVFGWYDAYPLWADLAWSMYIWPGLAGALLLLARSRQAVTAFLICVIASIFNLIYHRIAPVPIELDTAWPNSIPFLTLFIMIVQYFYAILKSRDGTLK